MCGRYYIDKSTLKETEKFIRGLQWEISTELTGDILPSRPAAVLYGQNGCLEAENMLWGFPRFDGNGLIINARAETALERKIFRESVKQRRCIIPAKGFYEWNSEKEKVSFERREMRVLFMAGCYNLYQGRKRFVIFTTEANESVSPVHDRMPVILEPEELENWLLDDGTAELILHRIPPLLKADCEYRQLNMFE